MPDGLLEHVGAVGLEESASGVAVLDGGELPRALDLQFADLHRSSVATRPVMSSTPGRVVQSGRGVRRARAPRATRSPGSSRPGDDPLGQTYAWARRTGCPGRGTPCAAPTARRRAVGGEQTAVRGDARVGRPVGPDEGQPEHRVLQELQVALGVVEGVAGERRDAGRPAVRVVAEERDELRVVAGALRQRESVVPGVAVVLRDADDLEPDGSAVVVDETVEHLAEQVEVAAVGRAAHVEDTARSRRRRDDRVVRPEPRLDAVRDDDRVDALRREHGAQRFRRDDHGAAARTRRSTDARRSGSYSARASRARASAVKKSSSTSATMRVPSADARANAASSEPNGNASRCTRIASRCAVSEPSAHRTGSTCATRAAPEAASADIRPVTRMCADAGCTPPAPCTTKPTSGGCCSGPRCCAPRPSRRATVDRRRAMRPSWHGRRESLHTLGRPCARPQHRVPSPGRNPPADQPREPTTS